MQSPGNRVVLFGIIMAAIGALMMFPDNIPYPGKLPGDITVKNNNFQLFIPVTTSIVLSVVLSLVMRIISLIKK